ncbi:CBS domain-containing protein [Pseudonocardia sp. TRM90224]|uniref:CBS domain-containing protein n=1 Tax=Pseudonocardia sp. TRM90224 TaxID=2812678 RepID=UPI001E5D4A8E|nr:CBS domain-containing protein [Pseudonocardia sp. TRM90224]
MARLVRDLMTSRVVTTRPEEPVSAAVERMTRYGFSALPVVTSSSRLVGMVSLLDVLRFREEHSTEGAEGDEHVRVREIMTTEVLWMPPTANARVVAQRLRSHGELRVLPVAQGGRLVGVVTRGDLLRHRNRDSSRKPAVIRWLTGEKAEDDAVVALARTRRTTTPPSGTPVRDVMTPQPITVRSADLISVAAELMLHHRHTALPVVGDGNRLVGILSEADILADPLAGRSAHATVGSVMTRSPISIDAGATVRDARAVVADRGLRVLPVVSEGVLEGVLSRSDLV